MKVAAPLLVLACVPALALAQSKRYPPDPVDKDADAAKKSNLWEAATNPQRTPYDALVAEARQLLEPGTTTGAKDAVTRLDQAVQLLPGESKAWRMRGDAHVLLQDWPKCATDYRAALENLKTTDVEARSTADLRRRAGLCLARAGKLAEAERVLGEAVASGASTGELWMRLGEVRIALGKLEEAISALQAARETGDVSQALVRWLLAGAYDRARRPSEAVEIGREAYRLDPHLAVLESTSMPLLGAGEREYLKALAHTMTDPPRTEHALLYFRRFVEVAPQSPWRKRAEEHVRELGRLALPEVVQRTGGTAPGIDGGDANAARAAVRKLMPPLRACMARLPGVIVKIEITKVGPRSAAGDAQTGRSRIHVPPEKLDIVVLENLDGSAQIELDGARRCMEPLADRVKATLPAIKGVDTYYRAAFFVISP
jgi:tetratricopeptide (TPR) repeat protein